MKRTFRLAAVTALAASALLITPGVASASAFPADCTLSTPTDHSMSLTCTARPSMQKWRLRVSCFPFGRLVFRFGQPVTGNGTSTADCGAGVPIGGPTFVVVP